MSVNRKIRRIFLRHWAKTNLRELAWARLSKEERARKKRPEKILLGGLDPGQFPDGFSYHTIIHHLIDVLSCAKAFLENPVIADRFKVLSGMDLTPVLLARVMVIVALHDMGKVAAGYQDQIFSGAAGDSGHVQPWLAALYNGKSPQRTALFNALDIPSMASWFSIRPVPGDENAKCNPLYSMIGVSTSHHGGRKSRFKLKQWPLKELDRRTIIGDYPMDILREVMSDIRRILPEAWEDAPPIPVSGLFLRWFSGLVMASDWMGSDSRNDRFPYWDGVGTPEERLSFASSRAAAMATDIGMTVSRVLGTPDPGNVLFDSEGRPLSLRPVQEAMFKIPTHHRYGLLEAPTGDGKTEAAIIRYLILLVAGEVDNLIFLVPTKSAGRELFDRIKAVLGRHMEGLNVRIVAAMGGDATDLYDDQPDIPWAAGHPARFMAAPVAVGTIDQGYLGILKVRHADLRAFLMSRAFLVIDEVHAADPYMTELTRALKDRHLENGGHVLLMSATLGSTARCRLSTKGKVTKPPPVEEAKAEFYPQIWHGIDNLENRLVTRDEDRIMACSCKSVSLQIASFESCISKAKEAAAQGARVLLIRSTVTDAVLTQERLEKEGVRTLMVNDQGVLHHGRYSSEDRKKLDKALLSVIGKESSVRKPGNGIVCVTTQTGEQSLDLNADLMITDPCPVDVFLQRLGRLHRHDGKRPAGFEKPLCLVLDPGPLEQYIAVDKHGVVTAWGKPGMGFPSVYKNLLSIKVLLDWIREKGSVTIPDDNREIIELGTHDKHLEEKAAVLGGVWKSLWETLYARDDMNRDSGQAGILQTNEGFLKSEEGFISEDHLSTRLGDGQVTVQCVPFISPLGGEIKEIRLPLRQAVQCLDKNQTLADLVGYQIGSKDDPGHSGVLLHVGQTRYIYSRLGLLKEK